MHQKNNSMIQHACLGSRKSQVQSLMLPYVINTILATLLFESGFSSPCNLFHISPQCKQSGMCEPHYKWVWALLSTTIKDIWEPDKVQRSIKHYCLKSMFNSVSHCFPKTFRWDSWDQMWERPLPTASVSQKHNK